MEGWGRMKRREGNEKGGRGEGNSEASLAHVLPPNLPSKDSLHSNLNPNPYPAMITDTDRA